MNDQRIAKLLAGNVHSQVIVRLGKRFLNGELDRHHLDVTMPFLHFPSIDALLTLLREGAQYFTDFPIGDMNNQRRKKPVEERIIVSRPRRDTTKCFLCSKPKEIYRTHPYCLSCMKEYSALQYQKRKAKQHVV